MRPGLVGITRLAQFDRVVSAGDLRDQAKLRVDLGVGAFDLDDEKRLAHRVARLGKIFAGLDAGAVHELDRDGQDAGLDDVGDDLPAVSLLS